MYFANITELLNMGGHGLYVWMAYGFALVFLCYLVLSPLVRQKRLLDNIRSASEAEARRQTNRH